MKGVHFKFTSISQKVLGFSPVDKRRLVAELRRTALELEALATLEECQAERLARPAKPNPAQPQQETLTTEKP